MKKSGSYSDPYYYYYISVSVKIYKIYTLLLVVSVKHTKLKSLYTHKKCTQLLNKSINIL